MTSNTIATTSNGATDSRTTTVDTDGNCTHHPTIKLRRFQKSTNTWKSIIKSCPLCSVRGTTPPRRSGRSTRINSNRSNRRSTGQLSRSETELSNSIRSTLSSSSYQSSSVRSIPIVADGDRDNNDSDDELNKTQSVDEDENDSLSPLEYSTHHLPPLCKQISTLSIGTSCDATVASTCSATSSQQSIFGVINSGTMGGYVGGDNNNEDQEQRMISPLDSSPSMMMQHCQPCSGSPVPPPPPLMTKSSRGGGVTTQAQGAHPQTSYSTPPPPPRGRKMYTSKSYSSGGLRSEQTSQHNLSNQQQVVSKTKKSVVCGQTYTNPITNQVGSYTGQLHPVTQVPHGIGSLRYTHCNGNSGIDEGEWYEGILVDRAPPPSPSVPSKKNAEQVSSRVRRYSSFISSRIEDSKNTSTARSSHRRSSAPTIQEHLNMPRLEYNNKDVSMDDGGSWCQPCVDDSVTSPPPAPAARSSNHSPSNNNSSVGGFGMDSSFICSPCSPPPSYSTSNKSRERLYQNSTGYSQQDSARKYSSSSNKVVEVSLPLNFEQQRVHSQDHFNQDDDDDYQGCETDHDGEESDDNSLGTYNSRASSNISRRSVKSHGGGSTRSGTYSARESK